MAREACQRRACGLVVNGPPERLAHIEVVHLESRRGGGAVPVGDQLICSGSAGMGCMAKNANIARVRDSVQPRAAEIMSCTYNPGGWGRCHQAGAGERQDRQDVEVVHGGLLERRDLTRLLTSKKRGRHQLGIEGWGVKTKLQEPRRSV